MEKVSFSFNSVDKYEDFVRQYYSLLETHPEDLQAFYGESSKLSRPGPDGKMATFSALSEIHDNIQAFGPKYHRKVFSMYSQVCENKFGFIVLVTGQVVRKVDNATRNFAQTFFFAVNDEGAFYILNDVFNYVDEPKAPAAVAVCEVASVSSSLAQKDVEVGDGGAAGGDRPASKVESYASMVSNDFPPLSATLRAPNSSSAGKKLVLVKPLQPSAPQAAGEKMQAPPVAEHHQQDQVEPSAAPPSAPVQEKRMEQPVNNDGNGSQPHPPAPDQPVNNDGNNRSQADNEKNTRYAVHLTKLPLSTEWFQLEILFRKFGTIKHYGGVQIRVHRNRDGDPEYKYAFVEFEKKSAMEAALKASPIMVNKLPYPIRRRW